MVTINSPDGVERFLIMGFSIPGPQVVVAQDYDGYFERFVRELIDKKQQEGGTFKSLKIIVNAGPYRESAVRYAWRESEKTLILDFYSALRAGFGSLSETDIQGIKDLF